MTRPPNHTATAIFKPPAFSSARGQIAPRWLPNCWVTPSVSHTVIPGRSSALARSLEIQKFHRYITNGGRIDKADTANAYEHAILTVQYAEAQAGSPEDSDVLVDEDLQPSAEFITLPAEGLRWGSSDGTEAKDVEAPGKINVMMDWVYTISRTAYISDASYKLLGNVNRAVVTSNSLGWTFAPETLLYSSINLSRQIFAEGPAAWKVTYRFTIKPSGWNLFWRGEENGYQGLYTADQQVKPYPDGNFLALTHQRTA